MRASTSRRVVSAVIGGNEEVEAEVDATQRIDTPLQYHHHTFLPHLQILTFVVVEIGNRGLPEREIGLELRTGGRIAHKGLGRLVQGDVKGWQERLIKHRSRRIHLGRRHECPINTSPQYY